MFDPAQIQRQVYFLKPGKYPPPLRHLKPNIKRDGVDNPVSQPLECPEFDHQHAGIVKPAVIPTRHHIYLA
jgi:hypothetical protein